MNGLDLGDPGRKVPGPADKGAARNAVHVLVLTRPDPDDPEYAEWEIEHPDCCPWVCFWTPTRTGALDGALDGAFDLEFEDEDDVAESVSGEE